MMNENILNYLTNYVKHEDCSLKLIEKQGKCLFENGKIDDRATNVEFFVKETLYSLQSNECNKNELELIALSCIGMLTCCSDESTLKIALERKPEAHTLNRLKSEMNSNEYGLMILSESHQNYEGVHELIKQLSLHNTCWLEYNHELLFLMSWEDIQQAIYFQQSIESELYITAKVFTSTKFSQLEDIGTMYKNLCEIKRLSSIFYPHKTMVKENELSLAFTVDKLSMEEAHRLLSNYSEEKLRLLEDIETQKMIQAFYDNNLNLAETARQLYIHRNTLIYRLDKLTDALQLDIRKFDEAFQLKFMMMVIRLVKSDKNV